MTKYIDADLLRKNIDNWKTAMTDVVGEYSDGVRFALEHFTFVLESLQQELDVMDLSFKGGTYRINGVEKHFNAETAKVAILEINEKRNDTK